MRTLLLLLALTVGCSWAGDRGQADLADLKTCGQIEPAWAAELASIQACTVDADCGLVLTSTSCGCTRDLVARVGADTTRFYALTQLGMRKQCALPLASTCDCPAADGFRCIERRCAWNYTQGGNSG